MKEVVDIPIKFKSIEYIFMCIKVKSIKVVINLIIDLSINLNWNDNLIKDSFYNKLKAVYLKF
jgi:hypothetical protein